LRTGETLYLRLGDKPFAALAAVVLLASWVATTRRRTAAPEADRAVLTTARD
jgi:apolipoprotein N-acyltransferase